MRIGWKKCTPFLSFLVAVLSFFFILSLLVSRQNSWDQQLRMHGQFYADPRRPRPLNYHARDRRIITEKYKNDYEGINLERNFKSANKLMLGERSRKPVAPRPYNNKFEVILSKMTKTTGVPSPPSTSATSTARPKTGTTLVTALLDIGRGKWDYYRRPFQTYLDFLRNILEMEVNLVLFIDEQGVEFASEVRRNLRSGTKIYSTKLADLPLSAYSREIAAIIASEQHHWQSGWDSAMKMHPEAKSAEYNIAVNSKSYFLYNASVTNPFNTAQFVWLDAGYAHGGAGVFPQSKRWEPVFPPDKISLIKLTPDFDKIEKYSLQNLYRMDWSVVSGGFLAGDANAVIRFHSVYYHTIVDLIVNQRKVDDDQTILVLLLNTYPSMFKTVHGSWFDAFALFP